MYHLLIIRDQSLYCNQDYCNERVPSEEDCTDSNDFACKNAKIHCILPNVPLIGKYLINGRNTYIPGGYAEINTTLALKCSIGFLSSLDKSISFSCSDKGEWYPPLRTCADRPGYCRGEGSTYIKEGTSIPAPAGICGQITCENAKNNSFGYLICASGYPSYGCHFGPQDYTKLYPDCCPVEVC